MSTTIGWIFLAYVLGTAISWYFAHKSRVENVIEAIIDRLIEEGYVKTKGSGANTELLKHWEKE